MSRDAGSIPAASTDAGVTTRLKPKQARQFILASLSFALTFGNLDYYTKTNQVSPQFTVLASGVTRSWVLTEKF